MQLSLARAAGGGAILALLLFLLEVGLALGWPTAWAGWHRSLLLLAPAYAVAGAVAGALATALAGLARNGPLRPRRAPADRVSAAGGRAPRRTRVALAWALAIAAAPAVLGLASWREGGSGSPLGRLEVVPGSAPWPSLEPWGMLAEAAEASPAAVPLRPPGAAEPGPGLIVLGIDGATWDLMLPLMEQGRLPNLARLASEGVAGVLRSDEVSRSPVVWTTIMTGTPPEQHGISSWEQASATFRRRTPLWSILGRAGRSVLVAGVPGSHPVDEVPGMHLAGFPVPPETRDNIGFVASTQPEGWQAPAVALPPRPAGRSWRAALVLRRQASGLSLDDLEVRRVLPPGPITRTVAALVRRQYARLDLEMRGNTLLFSAEGCSFRLGAGQWSPWLRIASEDGALPLHFRIKALVAGRDEVALYVTPLWRLEPGRTVHPGSLAARLDRDGPWVVEGDGWSLAEGEPRLRATLAEQQFGLATARARLLCGLLDEPHGGRGPDAVIWVATLTDRIQHPFWSFMPAELREAADRDGSRFIMPAPASAAGAPAGLSELVAESYVLADLALGSLLARASPEALIVVVSDHGFGSNHAEFPGAADHEPDGVYIMAGGPLGRQGPAGRSGHAAGAVALGPSLELLDVLPTILAAAGLPVGRDLQGRIHPAVVQALEASGRDIVWVPSHEAGEARAEEIGLDEGTRDQIRSLGYVR